MTTANTSITRRNWEVVLFDPERLRRLRTVARHFPETMIIKHDQ